MAMLFTIDSSVVGLLKPDNFALYPGGEPVYTLNQLYHEETLKPLIR